MYIRGLFLEGARWDSSISSINDSLPKQLYTELPVIHLSPMRNRTETTSGMQQNHSMKTFSIHVLFLIYAVVGVYRCPVYKILSRRGTLSTTGHSTNFIMWIEVPSNRFNIQNNEGKSDQEEWIRAGVAAFSSLMY